jgi:hypothetical protein
MYLLFFRRIQNTTTPLLFQTASDIRFCRILVSDLLDDIIEVESVCPKGKKEKEKEASSRR